MGIDAIAKRYSSLIVCLMIALAAYFQARGVGHLLVASVLSGTPAPTVPYARRGPPSDRDPVHTTSASAILARNAFDSVTGPIMTGEGSPLNLPAPPPVKRDFYDDPPCDMARVTLIVSSPDPDWSFAAITGPDGKTELHRRGDSIDGHTVSVIGLPPREDGKDDDTYRGERVWLTSGSGRCQLELGAKPPGKMGKPMQMQAGPPASDTASKLRKTGEHSFEIDRTAVDGLLANPAELMKVRVVPAVEDGRIVGMKLFNVKPGSLLGTLGIQNGDQLSSINGFEMTDPQKMMEAYSKLLTANKLSVTVVRGGRPVGIDVDIK
jgi:general secretion pathway protein C